MATTSSVENDFHFDNPSHTAFMCILYLSLGTIAIFANALNICIFAMNRELRANYLFHIIVDAGEIVNGISYILAGLGRGYQFVSGTFDTPITVHDCFYTRFWPVSLILGTEIPAWMTILVSTERIIAVHKPAMYNRIFSSNMKFFLVGIAGCCISASLLWAALSALTPSAFYDSTSTQHCAIISSTSKAYSTFHFIFVPFAYFTSFISLCTIAYVHRKTSHNITKNGKKGPMISIFIATTAFDVILCSAPSAVMIGASWQLFKPNDLIVSITYATTGFLSICHTVMNFVFHREYRQQVATIILRLMGINVSSTMVSNITRVGSKRQIVVPIQRSKVFTKISK